uniref:Putative terminase n=1 Tax=viral metagenome TaxID=1070528 RepID=A0A6M3LB00_9ZZZZ
MRGPYWDIAVFDEYAQIRPKVWPEIIRPALTDRKGWAIFIGTPQGKNHFHALWQDAQERPEWLARMYKASATKLLDTDELAQARSEMTPEQYEQEFECSFEAALLGAYYGPLIQDAADQGKISRVPHDPILPVHTAWDLGVDDATSIWFFQLGPGGEIRIIDYHEENGFGIDHYVKIIKEKPYLFETHLAPHDVKSRSMATGKSCYEVAESLGLKFSVVPKTEIVNGIQAVRSILPRCWFDEQKCDRGIQALKSYRKEFSERLSTYKANPLHDWSSHGADAFRYLATGMEFIESMRPKLKLKNPPALRARGEHGWML